MEATTEHPYLIIFDDIISGAEKQISKMLVIMRGYEIENDYSPATLNELREYNDSMHGYDMGFIDMVRSINALCHLTILERKPKKSGEAHYYFTSYEEDGALQDHLDNAMMKAGIINELPEGIELQKRSHHINRLSIDME